MDNFGPMKENVLNDKSYAFALKVIKTFYHLKDDKREFIISKQLIRSGTSTGAQIEEANQAQSKADFIHKLSIANKEAVETNYWIRLLIDSQLLDKPKGEELLRDSEELIKILFASIKTSKSNR